MPDSVFRVSLKHLRRLKGGHIEWPQLVRWLMGKELERVREFGDAYQGANVFIDRDDQAWDYGNYPNQNREDMRAYRLYREAHLHNDGCIDLGGQQVWLLTCQVPNQARIRGRRADLVGLRQDGSLVVFECKVATNKRDTPLFALLEGLDYLSHLLLPANVERFQNGLDRWRHKQRHGEFQSQVPPDDVQFNPESRHAVFVLAPAGYYRWHWGHRPASQQWLLSDRRWPNTPAPVEIEFATSDFDDAACRLVDLPRYKDGLCKLHDHEMPAPAPRAPSPSVR